MAVWSKTEDQLWSKTEDQLYDKQLEQWRGSNKTQQDALPNAYSQGVRKSNGKAGDLAGGDGNVDNGGEADIDASGDENDGVPDGMYLDDDGQGYWDDDGNYQLLSGSLAGAFGFPLIGFSRSVNPWSWARMIALCGSSWLVLSIVYPGMF